jgi:Domain of unknown function (DUF4276)
LLLYVEGDTEEAALPDLFGRWLDGKGSAAEIKAINFKGVGSYLREFSKRARRDLSGTYVQRIIGLVDLYGSRLSFPDGSVDEKYSWAKGELEQRVGDPRFHQHFAVHETEAWLLSGENLFPQPIDVRLPKTPPEAINFQNPPGTVLQNLYSMHLDRNYGKVVDGTELFHKLDPNVAYDRCPHLRLLLDDILMLAKGPQ